MATMSRPACRITSVPALSFIAPIDPQPRRAARPGSMMPGQSERPAACSARKPVVRTNRFRYSTWPSRKRIAWIMPSPS
jgi:hypothetical protein